ncbi:MAG: diaminopimelate epimerase [Cellvibrionales bacterium]|nr:diaminopimelate epimerase [Cellvibrionales bacterium]
MRLKFTKMQGLGNDFVVLEALACPLRLSPDQLRHLADRRTGVGCDQVLLIEPPTVAEADFSYRIFNRDGSEVAQCGNGARCFAKYVYDRQLSGRNPLRLQTSSGRYEVRRGADGDYAVDMGVPVFDPPHVPFVAEREAAQYDLLAGGENYSVSVLALGNPHCVLRTDDVEAAPVARLGAELECHPRFPQRANIGFMQVVNRRAIRLRVFERGVGETRACGSGAAAAVVAGVRLGVLDGGPAVQVRLPGGELRVCWSGAGQSVILCGPATTVFEGQIQL